MPDEHDDDHSQPMIIPGQDPLSDLKVAVGILTGRFDGFRATLKEIKKHCVTTSELEVAQSRCPGRIGATQGGAWSTLQAKLGVIVLCVTLLGSIGGAWLYTARVYSTVEQQQKREHKSRGKLKRDLAALIADELKKIKRGD